MLKFLPPLAVAANLFAAIGLPTRVSALGTGATSEVLTYDLAFTMRRLPAEDRPALSPDGRWLAYSVCRLPPQSQGGGRPVNSHYLAVNSHYLANGTPGRMLGTRLYVAEVATGRARLAGPASGNAWKPAWSPDGRQVAFFCDAGGAPKLWVYDVAGDAARKVSDLPLNPSIFPGDEAGWSPDGSELYVRLQPSRETGRQQAAGDPKPRGEDGPSVTVYRSGEEEKRQNAVQPSPAGQEAEWPRAR